MSDFQTLTGRCAVCTREIQVKSRQGEKTIACPKCNAAVLVTRRKELPGRVPPPLPQPVPTQSPGTYRTPETYRNPAQSRPGSGISDGQRPRQASPTDESEGPSLKPLLYGVIAIGILIFPGSFIVSLFATLQSEAYAYWLTLGAKTLIAAVGSLLGAVALRAGGKWGAGINIPYDTAYGTMLVAGLIVSYFQAQVVAISLSQDSVLTGLLSLPFLYMPPHLLLLSLLTSSQLRIPLTTSFKIVGITYLVAVGIPTLLIVPIGIVFWLSS